MRKFAITQMAKAKVDTEIAKLLTGHSIGVRAKYLNYTDDDLLHEYLKAVDFLTINEENRLKKQVTELREQAKGSENIITGKLQEKDKQIQELMKNQEEMERKFQIIFAKIDGRKLG
jgi:hypothetical protein